jgi:hypothetical protein
LTIVSIDFHCDSYFTPSTLTKFKTPKIILNDFSKSNQNFFKIKPKLAPKLCAHRKQQIASTVISNQRTVWRLNIGLILEKKKPATIKKQCINEKSCPENFILYIYFFATHRREGESVKESSYYAHS